MRKGLGQLRRSIKSSFEAMGIFDRFKRKKEVKEKVAVKTEKAKALGAGKREKKFPKTKKKISEKTVGMKKAAKKEDNIAHRILFELLVTEKSTKLGQFNKYVFRVDKKAGKNQIKKAIRDYYGVGVTGVNIIKIHPKKRIQGRLVGYKKGYKKAVVTLQEGDTISVAEGG